MRNSVVLPAPLGPMTPTMPPRGRSKFRSSKQQIVAIGLRDVLRLDDQVAQARPRRNLDFEFVHRAPRLRSPASFSYACKRALLFACAPRRHAHPFQFAFEGLLPLRSPASLPSPGATASAPATPCSSPRTECPGRGRVPGSTGDVVEEVAIVRHRDDGARIFCQMPFEPGDGLGVEMVRRFVEQQQVGLLEQHLQSATRRRSPPERCLHSASRAAEAHRVHRDLRACCPVP